MVKRKINYQKRLTSFLAGRKCVFCGSRKVCITKRRYIKCLKCKKQKSLRRLRFETEVIIAFVHQRPAYQVAVEYGVSYQTVHNIFKTIREILFHQTELESKKLSGQIEIDEAYFGGRKKGGQGRAYNNKSVVFGLLERDGRVYTRVVDNLTAPSLMEIIKKKTRKGSVYFTDQFRSYNSLHQFGKHLKVNHSKTFSTKRHNHICQVPRFSRPLSEIFCLN